MNRRCTIYVTNNNKKILCLKGDNLKDVLQAEGYLLPAFCGGRGICGKCEVYIDEKGKQLACRVNVQTDMTVTLMNVEKEDAEYAIVGHMESNLSETSGKYKIAIDIGTTTLAFSMLDAKSGDVCAVHTALNSQRIYGADVINRIQASVDGRGRELQTCIENDIAEGIQTLLQKGSVEADEIEKIAIVGNTVMLHLLRGYSCKGLCRYPFEPKTLGIEKLTQGEFRSVTILPGITAFVGADITAGVYACDMQKDTNGILIDMGTNGEIVLKAGGHYYVTSVAAGPAFEGGNILWGMGSVAGAIAGAAMDKEIKIKTIGDMPPIGICGTGLVEIVAELLEYGIVDETGKLSDEYFEKGYSVAKTEDGRDIVLTQKDIRQFQMTKAALSTGIEILLERAGIEVEDVDRVYLAGGFGCYLNIEKAAKTGLIPWELQGKTLAIGNTALLGAEKFLMDNSALEKLENIIQNCTEIVLSMEPEFQEKYIENINF